MDSMVTCIMAGLFVIAAFVSDIRSMTIPNRLNLAFLAAGAAYHLLAGGFAGGTQALAGFAAGLVPLLLLYLLKGIGAGDVKFFASLGTVVGMAAVLQIFMYAVLYGGLMGLIMLFVNRSFGRRILFGAASVIVAESRLRAWEASFADGGSLRFPFMIAVVPGALTAWYMMAL
ncbi:A24 family peptidase [Paenibacillus sacheonensis]|uniref:Prepilin peptidase n=1 Tax=Paenibacillus sacheonensis TaxID=742054 RepID=A0A7X4YS72_9BACL|nr:A24 family peptidase [Paenibacillus sacheonensis]MBM7566936.1 prepilin peptidase CpaA [Paenibacillus sacheonensis]NBC71558.1 prepilin peptidase [Paenibacillus sacheonensis]